MALACQQWRLLSWEEDPNKDMHWFRSRLLRQAPNVYLSKVTMNAISLQGRAK